MLRILDNCAKNATLGVLLKLLQALAIALTPNSPLLILFLPLSQPNSVSLSGSSDLIVRCLLRMSKSLAVTKKLSLHK